ncbi:PepSY domain-containing protein [Bacillus sp. H-16]|uniref:PepSY domain-containing protein n=1 Tax=Alteribacter salitolerans TaxID=2912333 RepID=UPI001963497F|nr:PepSY domain-containing protein [Alteribacter salitolerans]MBM7094286.1 PepSY domain-containing protein [Alteribacter salitolerans]
MKKLSVVLTSIFVIGGTSALAMANSNEGSVNTVDLDSSFETEAEETTEEQKDQNSKKQNSKEQLTKNDAVAIVKERFENAKIDEVELEKEKGKLVYEVEIDYKGEDGDVYVDAVTGEIVKVDSDLKKAENRQSEGKNDNKSSDHEQNEEKISSEKAGEIALAHIGEGYIDDIELEKKKGKLMYEVEIEYGNDKEVEVYLDAYTGEVLFTEHD